MLMLLIGAVGGPILYFATRDGNRADAGTSGLIGVGFWMTFLFANALRFDFRGDIDQLDVLKALPISPTRITLAQLIAPTIVLAMCQILLVGGVMIFLRMPAWILLLYPGLMLAFHLRERGARKKAA